MGTVFPELISLSQINNINKKQLTNSKVKVIFSTHLPLLDLRGHVPARLGWLEERRGRLVQEGICLALHTGLLDTITQFLQV